jgi:hypothetical protein
VLHQDYTKLLLPSGHCNTCYGLCAPSTPWYTVLSLNSLAIKPLEGGICFLL